MFTIMSSPGYVGPLPRELSSLIWQYIGVDLTELVRIHGMFEENPRLFRAGVLKRREWQTLANNCAAFYPPGCEWILALPRPLRLNRLSVMYWAIRHGNEEVATAERILDKDGSILRSRILSNTEYVIAEEDRMRADEVFSIAAIDSGRHEVFTRIMRLIPWALANSRNITAVHFAGRNFMGLDPRDFYRNGDIMERDLEQTLLTACWLGNIAAVHEILLQIPPDVSLSRILHLFHVTWVLNVETMSSQASQAMVTIVYVYMQKCDISFATILATGFGDRLRTEEHCQEEATWFAKVIAKMEGRRGLELVQDQFSATVITEAMQWLDGAISNDDTFWAEIGL